MDDTSIKLTDKQWKLLYSLCYNADLIAHKDHHDTFIDIRDQIKLQAPHLFDLRVQVDV